MDLTFTVNIRNNCTNKILVSSLDKYEDTITTNNLIHFKLLKPNELFSVVIKGRERKYSPILFNHILDSESNNIQSTASHVIMIYFPKKAKLICPKQHYITIDSTDAYTIHDKSIQIKTGERWIHSWSVCKWYIVIFF